MVYISLAQETTIHPENPLAKKRLKTKKFEIYHNKMDDKMAQNVETKTSSSETIVDIDHHKDNQAQSTNSNNNNNNNNNQNNRKPSIKVLRNKNNDIQIKAPPCSKEIDLYCSELRDMGGTYKEMQLCLYMNFNKLDSQCKFITNTSKYCDFKIIREICPKTSKFGPIQAADCIENFLIEYEKGYHKNEKLIKNFLSFSHHECIKILRNMSREFIDIGRHADDDDIRLLNPQLIRTSDDDDDDDAKKLKSDDIQDENSIDLDPSSSSSVMSPPLSMLEFAEMMKDEIDLIDNIAWKKIQEKNTNIVYIETDSS
jgi:hypothetical protein